MLRCQLNMQNYQKSILHNQSRYNPKVVVKIINLTYNSVIQNNLKEAALKCDEESERIAEQFLAGDMDCDKFLQVYIKSRTVSFIIIAIITT